MQRSVPDLGGSHIHSMTGDMTNEKICDLYKQSQERSLVNSELR